MPLRNDKRILVVGESCRDVFVYCDATRLAPDLPIPVLQVMRQKDNPGMAKNVERNIKAIYDACHLVTNENWRRVTKTRYMHHNSNHAFVRVDADHRMDRIDVTKIPLDDYDIIAISDYNKGFLHHDDIAHICANHDRVFIDTKKPVGAWLKDAAFIKINDFEFKRSIPIHRSIEKKIIRTMGGEGAEYRGEHYPVDKVEVEDSSGAGDSFFAALLVRFAETEDIHEAIHFANKKASEVVQKRGVTVISR